MLRSLSVSRQNTVLVIWDKNCRMHGETQPLDKMDKHQLLWILNTAQINWKILSSFPHLRFQNKVSLTTWKHQKINQKSQNINSVHINQGLNLVCTET